MPINRRRGGAHGWPCRVGCPVGANLHFHDILLHGALIRKIPVGLYVPLLEFNLAAIAVALLGSKITENANFDTRLPVPACELDSYPFSLMRMSSKDERSEERRVGKEC